MIQASSIQSPGLHRLLHAALRTLIDDFGAVSFNVGVLNIEVRCETDAAPRLPCPPNQEAADSQLMLQVNDAKANGEMEWSRQPPVQARIVSRGSMSSKASDFGGLEVFSGASIGHTDPYIIIEKLRVRLDALGM